MTPRVSPLIEHLFGLESTARHRSPTLRGIVPRLRHRARELSEDLSNVTRDEEDNRFPLEADRRTDDFSGWWRPRQGARRSAREHRTTVRQGIGDAARRRRPRTAPGDP